MADSLSIHRAERSRDRRRFRELPFRLYRGDPLWVPPLRSARARLFARKTAFFDHAAMALFLAERAGRTVGRVAAVHNTAHNDFHGDRTGFFGFFECEDADADAATALIAAAEAWLGGRGLDVMRGPVSPSMNAECGTQIDGFDHPPVALMPCNPPSYPRLLEGAGLRKVKDLYAYFLRQDKLSPGTKAHDRLLRSSRLLARRYPAVSIRPLNIRKMKDDILRFMPVFEEARRNNWGYVPVSAAEVDEMIGEFRSVVDPDIILFAEVDGNPAGVSLALPDVNAGLSQINGRLLPLGFLRFRRAMKQVTRMRIFGIAALEKYRHLGVTARLLNEIILRGTARGYRTAEASWVLEDNVQSNRMIENLLDPEHYKTYRLYEKPVERTG